MNKMLIVLRHEFLTIVKKPSFWFGILGMPFVVGIIVVVIGGVSGAATVSAIAQQTKKPTKAQGYVDQSGLIKRGNESFIEFADETIARDALAAGNIDAYYVVPADYLQTGNVRMIANEIDGTLLGQGQKTRAFQAFVNGNLLGNDDLGAQIQTGVDIDQSKAIAPAEDRKGPSFGGFSPLVYGVAILFFIVLMTASAYLMQTVTTEKENRVIEILMSSVTPTELLAGKILGLGLIGFIQLVLWFGSSVFALTSLPVIANFVGPISPFAVLATVVFFILGYFVYASLLAGLGALMPGGREAAQYTFFVLIPLFIPLYLNQAIGADPNGTLATALSLFPLTSMIVMPMRLFAASVPMWQVGVSLVLLAIMVYVAVTGAARVFRAQALLSGSKPTMKQVVAAFRG